MGSTRPIIGEAAGQYECALSDALCSALRRHGYNPSLALASALHLDTLHLPLHLSPHYLSYSTSYTPAPSRYNPSRTFARNTQSPRPPAPTTASPSIGSATTARTMSSALTSPKMTGLPVHVRYVTPLGRVASSARSPKRPMMDARKKEYSVTPGLGIRRSRQRGRGGGGEGEESTYR